MGQRMQSPSPEKKLVDLTKAKWKWSIDLSEPQLREPDGIGTCSDPYATVVALESLSALGGDSKAHSWNTSYLARDMYRQGAYCSGDSGDDVRATWNVRKFWRWGEPAAETPA